MTVTPSNSVIASLLKSHSVNSETAFSDYDKININHLLFEMDQASVNDIQQFCQIFKNHEHPDLTFTNEKYVDSNSERFIAAAIFSIFTSDDVNLLTLDKLNTAIKYAEEKKLSRLQKSITALKTLLSYQVTNRNKITLPDDIYINASASHLFKASLTSLKIPHSNLNNAYLSSADCSQVDFSSSLMKNVKADNTIFTKAILNNINASNSSFANSILNSMQAQSAILTDCDFSAANLQKADLTDATINSKTNFTNANLEEAKLINLIFGKRNFSSNRLIKTDFSHSFVSGSTFDKCDMNNSILSYANFSKCKMIGVNLENANLTHTTFDHANLASASLKNVNAAFTNFTNAILNDSDFTGAIFNNTIFNKAKLIYANFTNCDLSCTQATNACFYKATLVKTKLINADFSDTDFGYCNFSYSDLTKTNFTDCDLTHANLSNTILSNTDLSKCSLYGADLTDAVFFKSIDENYINSQLDKFYQLYHQHDSETALTNAILNDLIKQIKANENANQEKLAALVYQHPLFTHEHGLKQTKTLLNAGLQKLSLFHPEHQQKPFFETDYQKKISLHFRATSSSEVRDQLLLEVVNK